MANLALYDREAAVLGLRGGAATVTRVTMHLEANPYGRRHRFRQPRGSDAGMAFDEDMVRMVWEKGEITEKADPEIWRKDECGAWIRRNFFENLNSQFGWEIDLMVPEFEGAANNLRNLRPLQWQNKISKRAGRLVCPITAREWSNVRR